MQAYWLTDTDEIYSISIQIWYPITSYLVLRQFSSVTVSMLSFCPNQSKKKCTFPHDRPYSSIKYQGSSIMLHKTKHTNKGSRLINSIASGENASCWDSSSTSGWAELTDCGFERGKSSAVYLTATTPRCVTDIVLVQSLDVLHCQSYRQHEYLQYSHSKSHNCRGHFQKGVGCELLPQSTVHE